MHRSAQVWPDHSRFDPERFAPERVAGRHRMAWLPFGGGAHVGRGAQLATAELTVAIAELLGDFSVHPGGTGEPVPPVASGLVLRPGAPMPHRLVARQHP
jgi:cytochrome P450